MSWSADSYYLKAHKYWLLSTNVERASPEYLFFLSLSLEFIMRGAACAINPALNAAPNDDESILYAVGVSSEKSKTIELRPLLARLARLIPDITVTERSTVQALVDLRNAELHGDQEPFQGERPADLIPQLFSFVTKVVDQSGRKLEQVLTESDAMQARVYADALKKDRKDRVRSLIKIQKDRFFGLQKDEQTELRKRGEYKFVSAVLASGHHVVARKCPSCGSLGLLAGTPVGKSNPILRLDGIYEETRVVPERFECKCCDLKIQGLDELIAADFEHEFTSLDEIDPVDHFHVDIMEYIDTDDIIREHMEDMAAEAYMDE